MMIDQQTQRIRDLLAFQQKIGVPFDDLSHLDQALTHSSFINEYPDGGHEDNQRLEFLGDAILDFIVAEWLFHRYPEAREGELTSLRASIVRTESLAALGRELRVGDYLRMGRGEAASGGQDRNANLCATVEALVGAIYLDRGMETTRAIIQDFLISSADEIDAQRTSTNAKSYLQEYTQSILHATPEYRIVKEEGPDHAKTFTAKVTVDGEIWGTGNGNSKQAAQQAAAQDAIAQHGI